MIDHLAAALLAFTTSFDVWVCRPYFLNRSRASICNAMDKRIGVWVLLSVQPARDVSTFRAGLPCSVAWLCSWKTREKRVSVYGTRDKYVEDISRILGQFSVLCITSVKAGKSFFHQHIPRSFRDGNGDSFYSDIPTSGHLLNIN